MGKRTASKPKKPYPDFPLTANGNGQWSKKIRGRVHYFGPWADPQGALSRYLAVKDDLHAGREPRSRGGFAVGELCNHFLTTKKRLLDNGEITNRTFQDYHRTCQKAVNFFGKNRLVRDLVPDDFNAYRRKLAETLGPVALGNEIQRTRTLFGYPWKEGLLESPVRFGSVFTRPERRVIRQNRHKNGPRMFEAEQIRRMIDAANQPLRTMILLGINCGFGNNDCGTLRFSALDLDKSWVTFPRPKTGINRRCPLWPETVEALQAAIADRPAPNDGSFADLVFLTRFGGPWAKDEADSPVSKETRKLLEELALHRRGLGFYALRHTFETIAGETTDQVAVDFIMGHARDDMASLYRERISDQRLRAVTDYVRAWLFGSS